MAVVNFVFDRAFGRPTQSVDLSGQVNVGMGLFEAAGISLNEQEMLAAALRASVERDQRLALPAPRLDDDLVDGQEDADAELEQVRDPA